MKIYNFSSDKGKNIQAFDSKNLMMTKLLNVTDSAHMGCMYLESNGVIGLHQAPTPQLLLVINGEGWVKGKEDIDYKIKAGYAAYWEAGERHETRTEKGLTAIIVESSVINIQMKEELREIKE